MFTVDNENSAKLRQGEVSDYQQIVNRILPELRETETRHIAEHCYVYCKSPIAEQVYEAINHFYEVFDLYNFY